MAVVVNKSFLYTATFDVGTDTYTSAVQRAEFVPTTPKVTATDVSGATSAYSGTPTWVLNLNLFQDWTSSGLAKMFLTAAGTTVVVKVKMPGTQGVFTASVVLEAPSIGGDTNAMAQSTLTLNVVGAPVWSAS